MTTEQVARRRRPRGTHANRSDSSSNTRKLPEYLEVHEVESIIRTTAGLRAKLLMLEQWRAGLRIVEALVIEVVDLSLNAERPTQGASGQGRQVEDSVDAPRAAGGAKVGALLWKHQAGEARLCSPVDGVESSVQAAVSRAVELGAIVAERRIGAHTLRHSYARHLLMNGNQIRYLSRRLGHSSTRRR